MKNIKTKSYILSFIVPFLILGIYFASRRMAPFGTSSILTVDMGQQYVEFFAYFQHTILHNPGALFYSFSKGIGGEMVGTWAYYLMSPFNFLLLFFKGTSITSGILLITLLKYSFASLSMNYYLAKNRNLNIFIQIGVSVSYSLMAFGIANQLNIMWLDALIFLPLITNGIEHLEKKSNILNQFTIWMSLMIIVNYYFAYMIAIFSLIYLLFKLTKSNWKNYSINFLKSWIVTIGLTACLWLPTLWSLQQSKLTYTENTFSFGTDYNPINLASKFFPGAFSFKQMSSGYPNIYIGIFFIVAFVAYFFNRNISKSRKIKSLLITLFLLVSLDFIPFNLMWHAFQFPWWYPFRFSFIVSFWFILLGTKALENYQFSNLKLTILSSSVIMAVLTFLSVVKLPDHTDFMTSNQIMLGIIFFITSILLWSGLYNKFNPKGITLLLGLFLIIDISTNAIFSLNRISYVSQSEFADYSNAVNDLTKQTQTKNSTFYRVGSNFARTKDDAMQFNYNGGSQFNSSLESSMINLLGTIGQPVSSGNVSYLNGTNLSDSLLGFKYWMINDQTVRGENPLPTQSVRQELKQPKNKVLKTNYASVYENKNALPIVFMTSKYKSNQVLPIDDPITAQNILWKNATGEKHDLLNVLPMPQYQIQNINNINSLNGSILRKQKLNKPASVTFFLNKPNKPTYMTIGSNMNHNNLDVLVNGHQITENVELDHPIILSINQLSHGPVKVQIVLKKPQLVVNNLNFYTLDQNRLNHDASVLKKANSNSLTNSGNKISGTINVKNNHNYLWSSILYSKGWHLYANNKSVPIVQNTNGFLGAKVPLGKQKILLKYEPPFLRLGVIISLLTVVLLALTKITFKVKKATKNISS
ncbi:YfhO family protein [Pediococcus claussenii]|uniref:Bacterial membrane protein YfhO n=1 Tax=Pediococcus claussenii (strain ATCC BAA-344 / DSM 14800 / JCM 18046 / KCTC 3811 / LMG 21948 / P06) TaxID=701521 RepID=G8PDN4_PEDCP|nr:YfhO family protein [Pediococcus claussenii]AEV95369.1 hypothetical protein PECL_1106 [Pediococcus claussenii ATCC BAA-344]ANZ68900.1 hypothetical protein AYR57_00555 [Pediococcus claussenii]ANZ70716.1 hypothetical protein AYR58_00555 [Pediococcus claussenii]KRN19012.1 hypothetical protein IV79_GL001674 [Pediococcus claussenii]